MSVKQKLWIVSGILACVAVGLAISILTKNRESIGTVDTQVLIADQSRRLASAYPNRAIPPGVLQDLVWSVKQVIQEYGKQHHLILLAKGAVLSSKYPDYTESLQKFLKAEGLA